MHDKEFGEKLLAFLFSDQEIPESFLRLSLLNYLGTVSSSSQAKSVSILVQTLSKEAKGNYQPLHREESLPFSSCILTDCYASSVQAYDDIHFSTSTHPCGPVASVIFAIARTRPVSMAEALNALYKGMETECRIGLALFSNKSESSRGWYPTGIAGTIGAAVTAGLLLKLDQEQMQSALGLAATSASGVRGTHGSMAGTFVPALAAKNGYESALLAKQGFTCSYEALIGQNGLLHAIAKDPDYEAALKDIGKYNICTETSCKPYPLGYISFPIIDACIHAQKDAFYADHISLVVSQRAYLLGNNANPINAEQAIVSLPYIAARTLVSPDQIYLPLENPFTISKEEKQMMRKIKVEKAASLQDDQAVIYVDIQGEENVFLCKHAQGSASKPMTEEAVMAKYKRISHDANAEQTVDLVLHGNSKDLYKDLIG